MSDKKWGLHVFEGMPDYYTSAAIDANGTAFLYELHAQVCGNEWTNDGLVDIIGMGFDASDWENSLLLRSDCDKQRKLCGQELKTAIPAGINPIKPEDFYHRLCWYDERHPDFVADEDDDIVRVPPCYCDNCFYGRTALALKVIQLLNSLEELKKLLYKGEKA